LDEIFNLLDGLNKVDLQRWAGGKIYDRGEEYVGKVTGLSHTADGALAAWVTGTEKYAAFVYLEEDGDHTFFCTCPYDWGPCKHVVAIILAASDRAARKKAVPRLDEKGDLYRILFADREDDRACPEDDDADSEGADREKNPGKAQIEKALSGKSKRELVALLVDLAGRFQEVERWIIETDQLAKGEIGKLVRALRREIREITEETAWYDHWCDDGNIPDYSHLRNRFKALLKAGHADALLDLGEELWTRGLQQVEESNDDGDTAAEIADCMKIVLSALPKTSLTSSEQLCWMIDRMLEDEFSLLESAEDFIAGGIYGASDWQAAALDLESRLNAASESKMERNRDSYRRGRVLRYLLEAYEHCGWQDRIIPVLEKEARVCLCYDKLVDKLLTGGEREKARQWCKKGFNETRREYPGIAAVLKDKLRTIAEAEKRYDLVTAYWVQDFLEDPHVGTYREMKKAADKIGEWPVIRAAVLGYLEKGKRPDRIEGIDRKQTWPLPSPEVIYDAMARRGHRRFPDYCVLIDIAIWEKRFDDVVTFYRAFRSTEQWGWETDKKVARAVAESHPEVALDIWRGIVDGLIRQVNPKSYEEAAGYLKLMRDVYERLNRVSEWGSLLESLSKEHKAKRRLQEILGRLSKL